MEKLIVQQNKRQGRFSEFIKSSSDQLTLGRGFDNDITLSDHFIAVEQIKFYYEDGQWKIKLLDHSNPVLINNKPINSNDITIKHGDELIVGRTHLFLLLGNHPLERTRKLMMSNWMYHKVLKFIFPVLVLISALLLSIFSEYLELTGKIRWGQLVSNGLSFSVSILFFAGFWALIGRVLRHKPNFFIQLFYTSLAMAVLKFSLLFSGYTEYISASILLGTVVEIGIVLFILSMLLKYNLTYATELKRRGLISFSIISSFLLFGILVDYLEKRDFSTNPEYSGTVKAPIAKWSSDKSMDAYLKSVGIQFDELDYK